MEYNLKKTSIGTLQTCLDTVSEQPVDIDFTLPDYCPDIEKILRCKITPKIYNKNISGGQIQIDGTTVVTILYIDEKNKNLRVCEQSVPFSSTFQAKGLSENNIVDISTKVEYVNCRALSRRRLAVHGAFSLYAKAMTLDKVDLLSPENNDIECDIQEVKATALTAISQAQFTVCDEISVSNRPPVELILTSDVKANISDYKVISEKIMLNGELNVKLLYLSNLEKSEPEQIDYIIPFAQIVECENLREDSVTNVALNVMCHDLRLKTDMLSENPVVSVDAKVCVSVYGYNEVPAKIIKDAYSTDCSVDLERRQLSLLTGVNILKDSFMHKETLSLGDINVSNICDITVEKSALIPVISGEGVTLNCKINISILAFDEDKMPIYIERSLDFSKEIQCAFPFNNVTDISGCVASLSYRMTENNSIDIRCEMKYCMTIDNQEKLSIVCKIIGDEDNKIKKSSYALTLYYASAGERLWDIAKNYKTKLNLLHQENDLECEALENSQLLLIPMV